MNVLSLFDGMSCGQMALERSNIKIDKYFASEIDKYAIQITKKNYPNTIQLGNIVELNPDTLPKIDLLIGGSPCTNFSVAGNQEGLRINNIELDSLDKYLDLKSKKTQFKGQSYLFWEYIRILREVKPKYFLLENVKMNKKWEDLISNELCVKPIKINSSILTGQNRERLYWTNIPNVEIPKDKNIKLKDILDENVEDKYYLNDKQIQKAQYLKGKKEIKRIKNGFEYTYKEGGMSFPNDLNKKSNCLLASGQSIARTSTYIEDEKGIRKITPTECEKLQTVPIGYTEGVSDAQRYKMLGNGWTVDVIAHILQNIQNYETVYRGQPIGVDDISPRNSIWVTYDYDFANEYGNVKEYKLPKNINILNTDYYSEWESLVDEFDEDGDYDEYKYEPTDEFISFLSSKRYDGFMNGDNILIFNKFLLK